MITKQRIEEIKNKLSESQRRLLKNYGSIESEDVEYLLSLIELQGKVCEAARDLLNNFGRVYHGFPSKLEWPEIHVLKQALRNAEENRDA